MTVVAPSVLYLTCPVGKFDFRKVLLDFTSSFTPGGITVWKATVDTVMKTLETTEFSAVLSQNTLEL